MNDEFSYNDLYYFKKSNIHRYGIFAKEDIKENTILETPRYTILPLSIYQDKLNYDDFEIEFLKKTKILDISNYIFILPYLNLGYLKKILILPLTKLVFANWANSQGESNVIGEFKLESTHMFIRTTKYIKKDSEILFPKSLTNLSCTNIPNEFYKD